jgi:hypothetical protein
MPDGAPTRNGSGWLPWALLPPTAVWLGLTVLRESSLFWRNAGGYPVALRALVLATYYPVTGALLLAGAVGAVHAFAGTATIRRATVVGWLMLTLAVGFGLATAAANNIANLLDGRPLHYHPESR